MLLLRHCYYVVGVDSVLTVERGGMTIADREFCIGEQLTFRCTIEVGSHDWIVLPFLNGTTGFGRIAVGDSRIDGQFFLSSSGTGDSRMSSLQVTVFKGLIGDTMFTCAETGNRGYSQAATITVLGEFFVLLQSFIRTTISMVFINPFKTEFSLCKRLDLLFQSIFWAFTIAFMYCK